MLCINSTAINKIKKEKRGFRTNGDILVAQRTTMLLILDISKYTYILYLHQGNFPRKRFTVSVCVIDVCSAHAVCYIDLSITCESTNVFSLIMLESQSKKERKSNSKNKHYDNFIKISTEIDGKKAFFLEDVHVIYSICMHIHNIIEIYTTIKLICFFLFISK